MEITIKLKNRFLSKYKIDLKTGCWNWVASKNKSGYGYFRFNQRTLLAHRASFIIYNGEITGGLHVLHKCDNPSCVNPEHLFLGTHSDNMNDMASKGRCVFQNNIMVGESHVSSKLCSGDVIEIKRLILSGSFSGYEIARKFSVSRKLIYNIQKGIAWKHI